MPLEINWGTPVDAYKAGRLADLLYKATGVLFEVQTVGLINRTFELVSVGTVQTNYGGKILKVNQPDGGGSMVIPDDIIARIASEKVPAFKIGLRQEGVVLFNLVEKPQEWFKSTNFSGGYRKTKTNRRKGRKTNTNRRKGRKTQRRRRN